MSDIKFVFIDLDDTIFDFHASEGRALSGMLRELGVEPTADTLALYSKINRGQWESLERGEATREEILVRRFEILFDTLGISKSAKDAQRIYEHNLSLEYIYIEGAEELLENLYGKYKLTLLQTARQRCRTRASRFRELQNTSTVFSFRREWDMTNRAASFSSVALQRLKVFQRTRR